jgi:pyruvate formate lyase activating enzyme
LLESAVEYEFRTTFVPGLLKREDLLAIAAALDGCRRYVVQKFKPTASLLDPALRSAPVPQRAEMEELARDCRAHIETVELRGF